jgi:hypothetical protein
MKAKITLALDSGLLRDAKLIADEKGVSLSALVETCLEQVVSGRKTLRTYDRARKRALARLRKGMYLLRAPARSRDQLHERRPDGRNNRMSGCLCSHFRRDPFESSRI